MAQYPAPTGRQSQSTRGYTGALSHSSRFPCQRSRPQVPSQLKGFFAGLQQRQLDAIAFFLRTKETSKMRLTCHWLNYILSYSFNNYSISLHLSSPFLVCLG